MRKAFAALLVLALAAALGSPLAYGQAKDFPNRPIRIVVPFTAGSGSDTASRFFGDRLAAMLGQPAVVENRPGANGVIAITAVKSAPADGYTILLASTSLLSVNPIAIKDLPYDPLKDFKPVTGLTRGMNVIVVAPESDLRTVADLVAAVKKDPKPIHVGSYSMGYRLAFEWFAGMAGFRFSYIPYKGGAPVFSDVMGRQLDVGMVDMGGASTLIKAGRLRALAVTGEKRHPDFPDIPTLMESGYPEYVNYAWTSWAVRAETPEDVTAKLASAMQKILAATDAREYTRTTGGELMPLAPAAMQKFQRDELDRFRRIAEAAGIKPE